MTKRRNKAQLKAKRRKLSKQPAQARQYSTWLWLGLGGGVLVLLVIGLFLLGNRGSADSSFNIEGLAIVSDPGRGHVDGDIDYAQPIPAGGLHNPVWLNCGIYDEPVRTENAVHSLEHGAVWIAYQPDLPDAQLSILRDLVQRERTRRGEALIILAPHPEVEVPITLTAWQAQLEVNDASDERIGQFVSRFQNGPFAPEVQANCTFGGTGEPLS